MSDASCKPAGTERWRLVSSLWGVLAMVAVYGLVHASVRLAASPTIGQDDVIANLFGQSLEIGYWYRNPPLYDWLLWGVQRLTGPNLASFLLLKYLLLLVAVAFFFGIALRITGDRLWAGLTALAPALCYQIGWNIHEGVTHTMALTCVLAASFYVFLGLVQRCRTLDYVLFGVCVGLGGLAKYNYAAFLGLLVAASCLQAPIRRRLADPRILISITVASLIMTPFYLWLLGGGADLGAIADETLERGGDWSLARRLGWTLWRLIYVSLNFLGPLLLVVPLLFPKALASLRRRKGHGHDEPDQPDFERLILHMLLLGYLLLAAGILFFGVTRLVGRHMHPFLLLGMVWLMLQARHGCEHPRQIRRFLAVLGAAVAFVLVLKSLILFVSGEPFCRKCRQLVPFAALADALHTAGFEEGVLIAGNRHIAGNMRGAFPEATVVCLDNPKFRPPGTDVAAAKVLAVVWNPATDGPEVPSAARQDLARWGWQGWEEPRTIDVQWRHWRPKVAAKRSTWKFLVLSRDATRAN